MTTTGESKVISLFYRKDTIWTLMEKVCDEFREKYRLHPTMGGIHSKYSRLATQTTQLPCGGFNELGVHWHFVHFSDDDKLNATELYVTDATTTYFHGI